jgi:hypothetical protein
MRCFPASIVVIIALALLEVFVLLVGILLLRHTFLLLRDF